MGFTLDDSYIRVEMFKPSGKWYETIAPQMEYAGGHIVDRFRKAVEKELDGRLRGYWAVCFDPYDLNPYPLMIKIGE